MVAATTTVGAGIWTATMSTAAIDAGAAAAVVAVWSSSPVDLSVAGRCSATIIVLRHHPRCQLTCRGAFRH